MDENIYVNDVPPKHRSHSKSVAGSVRSEDVSKRSVSVSTRGLAITTTQSRRDTLGNTIIVEPLRRNCCSRCCRNLFVHGSCIGPASCSFISLCSCWPCCKARYFGHLNRSSFATKLVYLISLAFIMACSAVFILGAPYIFDDGVNEAIDLPPCRSSSGEYYEIGGWWKDCRGHGGYFLVYRLFLAYDLILFFLAFCTIGATTSKDFCRPSLHQGFWLCKFLLYVGIAVVVVMFITVNEKGSLRFDEVWMYCGLAGNVLFSIPQLIFFLEIIEKVIVKIKAGNNTKRGKIIYWGLTLFTYLADFALLVFLCLFYTYRIPSRLDNPFGEAVVNYGMGSLCLVNVIVISYCLGVGIVCTAAMIWHRYYLNNQVYPNVGLLHSAFVFGHTIVCVYVSLGNSVDVECRFVWYPYRYNPFSLDVTSSAEGMVHVAMVSFTIIYFSLFAFTNSTAPLSKALDFICCKGYEQKQEVDDDELSTERSYQNIPVTKRQFLLLNDEAKQLQYSWACFHVFLILGSLSIMMGLTNFIRPIADGPNASSYPAFWCRFSLSPATVLAFLVPIIYSWVTDQRATDDGLILTDLTREDEEGRAGLSSTHHFFKQDAGVGEEGIKPVRREVSLEVGESLTGGSGEGFYSKSMETQASTKGGSTLSEDSTDSGSRKHSEA